jgi:hypothetical protein
MGFYCIYRGDLKEIREMVKMISLVLEYTPEEPEPPQDTIPKIYGKS